MSTASGPVREAGREGVMARAQMGVGYWGRMQKEVEERTGMGRVGFVRCELVSLDLIGWAGWLG